MPDFFLRHPSSVALHLIPLGQKSDGFSRDDHMWPDAEQTQQLLAAAKTGDDDAVNRLLERHRESLRRVIHLRLDRALAARVDASDVVQDVMLEANQRMRQFLTEGSEMPFHLWLRQLAKDRVIDMHRKHRQAQRRSVDREQAPAAPDPDKSECDLAGVLVDGELTPAAANIRRELEQRFLLALEQLPEDDREIIMMRHYEHLGNSEVAAVLKLTPAAAGMRYLRALRKLRSVLGSEESP